jgi:hypothetical protein
MFDLSFPLQVIQDQESLEKLEATIVVHPCPTWMCCYWHSGPQTNFPMLFFGE